MAAQLNVFKIIGDSNTRNAFSTRLKLCERITGLKTEFISASAYSSGLSALSDLGNTTVVYISFLTNGLVDSTELCSDLGEIDGVIQNKIVEYIAALRLASSVNPNTNFYMMPPMTRTTPFWLESKLPQITGYVNSQSQGITNLTVLPPLSVTKDNLETDGVHLNRESQSRLFTYIMESLFPDKISTKTKNVTRDRHGSDEEMGTPPTKKSSADQTVFTPTPSTSTWSLPGPANTTFSQNPFDIFEEADAPVDILTTQPDPPGENEPEDDGSELVNPDLQRLYHMISKKIDTVKSSTSIVQAKVDVAQREIAKTSRSVEINTHILRSLHIRTAAQAETLDAHSNTLNLNFVMISGVPATLISAPGNDLPGIKLVMDKLLKSTPLLVSAIRFAVYARYIKHQEGKLPTIKASFINPDSALAFRDAANKLRIAKKDFWSNIYVSNDPTKSTRVRISILQALAKRLAVLPANNGKTIFVSRFDVKPQLCFKFGGRVEKRLDFVAAMEKYRSLLQQEDKETARKIAGKTFSEDELRQFIVL